MTEPRGTKRDYDCICETGTPPPAALAEKRTQTLCFKIHNFQSLCRTCTSSKDGCIATNAVEALGYEWSLCIFPRKMTQLDMECDRGQRWMSLALKRTDTKNVWVTAKMKIPSHSGSLETIYSPQTVGQSQSQSQSIDKWLEMSSVKDKLDKHGTIAVTLELSVVGKTHLVWFPRFGGDDWLQRLHQTGYHDATFRLRGFDDDVEFHCSKAVLALRAPKLLDLFKDNKTCVSIWDVTSSQFSVVHSFVNTGKIKHLPGVWGSKSRTKGMIEIARKYEIRSLDLYAESVLASTHLKDNNAAELMVFAHRNKCPLLLEYAVFRYKAKPKEIMRSEYWKHIQGSNQMLNQLLHVMAGCEQKLPNDAFDHKPTKLLTEDEIDSMRVGTLRGRLDEANLSMNGSREELESRLKNYVGIPQGSATGATDAATLQASKTQEATPSEVTPSK